MLEPQSGSCVVLLGQSVQVAVVLCELQRQRSRFCREMPAAIYSADFGKRRLTPMWVEAIDPNRASAALASHMSGMCT